MASLNKVILIGNLGKGPEVRYTPAGQTRRSLKRKLNSSKFSRQTTHPLVTIDGPNSKGRENRQSNQNQWFRNILRSIGNHFKKLNIE